ncbi:MAG: hypothetical protein HOO06_08840 [Bdellovibrionaceae bacterium]|jgi:hypothetical protein|nr:hypothetical protein [Pseudobdellovibrionaceae bacterium]
MKSVLISLSFIMPLYIFASEYGEVTCLDHNGNEISSGMYMFEKENIKTSYQDNLTGFILEGTRIVGKPFHYTETNCNDKSKEYRPMEKELLICASGKIVYADGPYCQGPEKTLIGK